MTWSSPNCSGEVPLGRYGHGTFIAGDMLVVFGGMSEDCPFNDVLVLDLGLHTRPPDPPTYPLPPPSPPPLELPSRIHCPA